jgi:4-hydroxybenzoate polyprenyltransferase
VKWRLLWQQDAMNDSAAFVPDTQHRGLVSRLPARLRPFALLARFDRPIGWWLLFWPCAWGVWLAGAGWQFALVAWLLLGAIAMRGAGCVYNDIVDRDLDRQVARTRVRPLASGAVSLTAAWEWLGLLCLVGLAVWFQLGTLAKIVAIVSLAPVAAYPFMKRITWWPQAWLGIVFSWAALVGWTALRSDRLEAMLALWLGSVFWCIGYDTIYALQDKDDDALVGIRSSALRLGESVKRGVLAFYGLAIGCWALALWWVREDALAMLALVPAAGHLLWQALTLDPADGANALERFRSNRFAGLLVAAACFVVGNA